MHPSLLRSCSSFVSASNKTLKHKAGVLSNFFEVDSKFLQIEVANSLEESLHNNSFAPQAAQKLEQLETELERERELQNKIQADYNELCIKVRAIYSS